jgi:uridylate kinase
MKVVVSIGGSVLAPDEGPSRVSEHAAVIEQLEAEGCTVAAVVGGGTIAREYIGTARGLGANEIALDEIGIAATRLNARLLIAALGDRAVQEPPTNYEQASATLRRGEVCVMGGVVPAQTTDAVSAALAEYVNADLLVYATSVPGVFTADPNEDETAERLPELSAEELVDVISDIEMAAGSSAPVDILAAKVIQRSGMRAIVLDGTDPERVLDAVRHGRHDGTDIIPAGSGDEPTYWASEASSE